MKKLIASILPIVVLTSTVSTVISCSPRSIDTSVYRMTYKLPMQDWNGARTMASDDSWVISNLEDTLTIQNRSGNTEGDLAYAWTPTVDETTGHQTWHISLKDVHWSDNNGNKEYKLDGGDFFNTFRYIMNPLNLSENTSAFSGYVVDGSIVESVGPKYQAWLQSATGKSIATEALVSEYIDAGIIIFNIDPNSVTLTSSLSTEVTDFINSYTNIANADEDTDLSNDFNTIYDLTGKIINEILQTNTSFENVSSDKNIDLKEQYIKFSEENGRIFKTPIDKTMKLNKKVGDQEVSEDCKIDLEITLPTATPFFESIMSFGPWSPLPDIALEYNNSIGGRNYGQSPNNIWYSGAYMVKKNSYNARVGMTMVQNPNYFAPFDGRVKKVILTYNDLSQAKKSRELFEARDVTEAELNAADSAGWRRYVGDSGVYQSPEIWTQRNPNATPQEREEYIKSVENSSLREGTLAIKKPNPASYGFLFNFFPVDGTSTLGVLALKSVRAAFAFFFDRNQGAQYYAQAQYNNAQKAPDLGIKLSAQTRNHFTVPSLVKYEYNGSMRDYSDDLNSEYATSMNGTGSSVELTQSQLTADDGNDIFYHNINMAIYALQGTEVTSAIDYSDLISKLQASTDPTSAGNLILEQVKKDLTSIGKSGVALSILQNGADKETFNFGMNESIDSFNKILNDHQVGLSIKPNPTTNAQDYFTRRASHIDDIVVGGWSPDYTDPISFLNTLKFGGDYQSYVGYGRMFSSVSTENVSYASEMQAALSTANDTTKAVIKTFGEELGNYSTELNKSNTENTEPNHERYRSLATDENLLINKNMMFLPIYAPTSMDVMAVTHVNPFTRSNSLAGVSLARYYGIKLVPKQWTQQQYWDNFDDFVKNPEDYSTYHDFFGRGEFVS